MESYKVTLHCTSLHLTTTCRIVPLPGPPFSLVVVVQRSIARIRPPPCGDPVCIMSGLGTLRTLPHEASCTSPLGPPISPLPTVGSLYEPDITHVTVGGARQL